MKISIVIYIVVVIISEITVISCTDRISALDSEKQDFWQKTLTASADHKTNTKTNNSINDNENHHDSQSTSNLKNQSNQITNNQITDPNEKSYKKLIVETIYDLSESVKEITISITSTIAEFAADTRQILTAATYQIKSAITVLAAKIIENQNGTVKFVMENVKYQLQQVQELFDEVSILTEQEIERVMLQINETLLVFSHDMDTWSTDFKLQLKSYKDDKSYDRSCQIIDEFINESFREMSDCCNIAIRPSKSICNNVKDIFWNTLDVVVDTVSKIDECMVMSKGSTGDFVTCINQAMEQVGELFSEAAALKERLLFRNDFPLRVVMSNGCVSLSTYSIEIRKTEIERAVQAKYLKKLKHN